MTPTNKADKACCDTFPGFLTVLHHRDDLVAQSLMEDIHKGLFHPIHHQRDMSSHLSRRGAAVPDGFAFQLHRLTVPAGEEVSGINEIWAAYGRRVVDGVLHGRYSPMDVATWTGPGNHILLAPDHALSHRSTTAPVVAMDKATRQKYDQLIGLPYPSRGAGVTVAIIDSGLDHGASVRLDPDSRNFANDQAIADVSDVLGHGTAVAGIIAHVAPDADLLVLKVGDQDPVSEWNVCAALLAAANAEVINLSLGFGLPDRDCPTCGRGQTGSSRSVVFERIIDEVARLRPGCVIVAAAGNQGQGTLDYPSRYPKIVAVGAVDSAGHRSIFGPHSGSNWGTEARTNATSAKVAHDLVFFAPGGSQTEPVITTVIGGRSDDWSGTSFAAPHVSALFALYLGDTSISPSRAAAIQHFKDRASRQTPIPNLSPQEYGNGLIGI